MWTRDSTDEPRLGDADAQLRSGPAEAFGKAQPPAVVRPKPRRVVEKPHDAFARERLAPAGVRGEERPHELGASPLAVGGLRGAAMVEGAPEVEGGCARSQGIVVVRTPALRGQPRSPLRG
jgi:hypothetical protein